MFDPGFNRSGDATVTRLLYCQPLSFLHRTLQRVLVPARYIQDLVDFRRGDLYLISVGSVGQPRDYDNRACFVVCDTTARTVEYIRVEYDIESAARRIFEAELAPNFGRRLFLGV